jgi:GAF domain-containing protein
MLPLPIKEDQRVALLRAMEVLDTPPSPNFDRICTIAREYFQVPIAFVSFVDENRQWFKARCGISLKQTPREHAFCSYTVLQDDFFIVNDAFEDERFRENPLVVGEPYIRFYAGAPITFSSGIHLGSVCIADRVPRRLDTAQRGVLKDLAGIAVSELRLIQAGKAYFRREYARGNET